MLNRNNKTPLHCKTARNCPTSLLHTEVRAQPFPASRPIYSEMWLISCYFDITLSEVSNRIPILPQKLPEFFSCRVSVTFNRTPWPTPSLRSPYNLWSSWHPSILVLLLLEKLLNALLLAYCSFHSTSPVWMIWYLFMIETETYMLMMATWISQARSFRLLEWRIWLLHLDISRHSTLNCLQHNTSILPKSVSHTHLLSLVVRTS